MLCNQVEKTDSLISGTEHAERTKKDPTQWRKNNAGFRPCKERFSLFSLLKAAIAFFREEIQRELSSAQPVFRALAAGPHNMAAFKRT